jgi:hypothetical protein
VKHPKPENISDQEWDAVKKSVQTLTEYFPNIGIFINWVDEKEDTQHYHLLTGNTFAIEHQISKWSNDDFDMIDWDDDEDEDQ